MKYYNHITLIGDMYTGKSSFVKRLLGNNLLTNYDDQHNIEHIEFTQYDSNGDTFTTYFVDVPANSSMQLHYLEKPESVMIFCDYTKLDTLESAIEWIEFINKNILCYLIITKIDKEGDIEFNNLLEENSDKFKKVFRISLKNMQLNKIQLKDIILLINYDILDTKN